jgi:tetratricopeptide (TPR) repeat protein
LNERPHIVHFSGHGILDLQAGLRDDPARDLDSKPPPAGSRLIFQDVQGNKVAVSQEALVHLFKTIPDNLRVVVLNACHTRPLAEAIAKTIDCTIGMNRPIGDEAAIAFATEFYGAIGFGRSVKEAFELGKAALLLEGIPEEKTPELLTRQGIDAAGLVLIASPVAENPGFTRIGSQAEDGEEEKKIRVFGRRPPGVADIFKGRTDELKEVGRLLAGGRVRLVSILGQGGIGKTALAKVLLLGLEESRWPQAERSIPVDGIAYFSTQTDGITLERLFLGCAKLLDGDGCARLENVWASRDLGSEEKVTLLLQAFKQGLYVVLLDNLESLIDVDGRLTDPDLTLFLRESLQGPRHGLRVLVTSREPLRLDSDVGSLAQEVWLQRGLGIPEGVQLLRELDPNCKYTIGCAHEEKLTEVVRRTHGVPRALQLVVSIMADRRRRNPYFSLDEVVASFYSQDEVVKKLVDENYRRLPQDARRVAEALAVYDVAVQDVAVGFLLQPFAPGVDVLAVLGRLYESHLVEIDQTTRTASLHPIDKEYLYQRLPGQGPYSRQALHERAAEYYHSRRIVEPDEHFGLDTRIDLHVFGPQLSEFNHRVKAGQTEEAAELLMDFGPALAFQGSASLCREMIRAAAGVAVAGDRARLGLLASETALRSMFGPAAQALEVGEQASEVASRLDPRTEGAMQSILGIACRYMGDAKQAVTHFERALGLYRRSNDAGHGSHRLLGELSLCHSYAGNIRQALYYGRQLLELAEQSAEQSNDLQFAHNVLSLAYFTWGRWEEAIRHGDAVLAYWQRGMHDSKAYTLNTIGLAHFLAGRYPEAVAALYKGRATAAELESPRAEGFCLYNLALVCYLHGSEAEARRLAEEAQPLLSRVGLAELGASVLALLDAAASDRATEARVLLKCARLSANNPDLFPARDLAARACELAQDLGLAELASSAQRWIDDFSARMVLPAE